MPPLIPDRSARSSRRRGVFTWIKRRRAARWFAFVLAALMLPRHALGQRNEGNVFLEANEPLFCILSALNAGGYDTGLDASPEESARAGLRAALAEEKIPVLPEIRKFYQEHRMAADPGRDLGQYVSLALLLGPPPDFRYTVAASDLPPDAREVSGLVPLLKEFYQEANLSDFWVRFQPRYQAALVRYSAPIRNVILRTDAYLRFPSGAYLGRTYTIYVDLLGVPEQVQARIYGENYFVVVTPSRELKLDEIRHQYMHFLLDPLASKYAKEIDRSAGLEAIARQAPALERDFKTDFPLLVTECLIRAAEIRLDHLPKAAAEKKVHDWTATGLILVPYFYGELGVFQKQAGSMEEFYPTMIRGIDADAQAQLLANIHFTKPAAGPLVQPELSASERLLEAGDRAIYQGNFEAARTAFEEVLQKYDAANERALFGLAVAESNLRKPDLAIEYFQKTLASAHDLRIITWSHIYLGRIDDVFGRRKQALEQYRAAALTAAGYPDAQWAVQAGLAKPYGSNP